jgi:hypothetical protein
MGKGIKHRSEADGCKVGIQEKIIIREKKTGNETLSLLIVYFTRWSLNVGVLPFQFGAQDSVSLNVSVPV